MSDLNSQRAAVRKSREELEVKVYALARKYDSEARRLCPFDIGEVIEYEPGRKGEVREIFFPREHWLPLEDQEPDSWAVTGPKIKKDGNYGKKNFQDVGNKTHVIEGKRCRRKTLDDCFGRESG